MINTTRVIDNLLLIEPAKILPAIKKNWWFVIVVTLFFATFGIYVSEADKAQTYSSTAKLIRYDRTTESQDIPYQFQNFNYTTALETIRTRENLLQLIDELALKTTPEEIFSKFEINHKRKSNIVEIKFTSRQKEIAALGANRLSEIFIKNFSEVQNAATLKIYNYYEKEKNQKIDNVIEAKNSIQTFLKENDLLSIEDQLQMLYDQLNAIEIKQLETLEEKILELKDLQKKYTSSHPKVKSIQMQISQLEKNMDQFKLTTSMQNRGRIEKENPLSTQVVNIKTKIVRLTNLKQQHDQLLLELEEVQDQLKIVRNRLYDIQISLNSTNEDFKFFEYAKVPNFPNPKKKKIIVIALTILGVIFSILVIVVKEILNPHIKTIFDLKKRFGFNHVIQFPRKNYKRFDIKHIFSYLAQVLIKNKKEGTQIISVGIDTIKSDSSQTISMLLEQLEKQEKKILYVEQTLNEKDIDKRYLFSLDNSPSKENFYGNALNKSIDKIYWFIDKNYTIFVPNEIKLKSFFDNLNILGYDYVVINVVNYIQAEHLIPKIVSLSDDFIMVTTFKKSDRKVINSFASKIDDSEAYKINGVINEVHKYYIY